MLANTLLVISGALLLTLCLVVFLSNSKKPVNRALVFFLASGFLWLLANFLTNISDTKATSLFFTRSTLIGASLIPLAFLSFATIYTRWRNFTLGFFLKIAILPAVIILFTPTHWNISSVEPGGRDAVAGPVYVLLLAVILSYFALGIYILAKYYRRAVSTEKAQMQYIFAGLAITLIPAFITNGLLPLLGSSDSSAYGPIMVVGFSIFTTIAIIRHRLLDIRLVVARSLTYVLLAGSMAVIFASLIFTITSIFFKGADTSLGLKIVYILTALLIAFIYQPLKRVFDRLSDKLFYRDAYDSQELLNSLNKSLVTTIDLEELLTISSRAITDTLKTDFCFFVIKEGRELIVHPLSNQGFGKELSHEAVHALARASEQNSGKVIVVDSLESDKHHIKDTLQSADASVLVKLQGRTKGKNQSPGFMVLGHKRSGALYSSQDTQVLEIIADELVIAVQNSLRFEEIRQFNITLQEKIEAATKELRHTNAKLKALDEAKDEFISMASHQLRTPLTAIKGYLSMILEGDAGPIKKEQKDMVQQSFEGAQRMVYLIADLLNVSRLQTGKFVIDNHPTNLAEVIVGEITQLKEQISNREITLTYDKPDNFPVMNLDETKIRQVIMNFLDNALYYTPKGGTIEVKLVAKTDSVEFTVKDTGVGVPKAVQHSLFTKFYRADNARKMRPDGTGLGLFMAKKVVVSQGGAIIFNSVEGQGSTFGFSFPRAGMEIKGETTKKLAEAEKTNKARPG